ncbi:MAG TPA: hypothetical protein VKE40_11445 [Gemmataceae bacterium]|nr:hypothetical protein [Gemmataceae bacterium]
MSVVPWTGVRRVAVVPVFNKQVDPPPPPDWAFQVRSRVFYDPDPATGQDRSFQNYLHALSYGRAFIDGEVFPPVFADDAEVNIPAMNSLPAGHGYTHLLAVLPHSFGPDRGGFAFWDFPPVNGITAWARVALYDDRLLTVRQPIGVWGMEILHMTTKFTDLYFTNPNLGNYDVMAGAGASTHASAHTKQTMGWLPFGKIVVPSAGNSTVKLQAIAMPQPPPPDRATAVRIPSKLNTNHFMVEARLAVDAYEKSNGPNDGIPAEGVIVYEVANTFSVFLRSIPTLSVGKEYTNAEEGLRIRVKEAIPGGFTIDIQSDPSAECPRIRDDIATLKEILETEEDPIIRRQLRQKISALEARAKQLGCP